MKQTDLPRSSTPEVVETSRVGVSPRVGTAPTGLIEKATNWVRNARVARLLAVGGGAVLGAAGCAEDARDGYYVEEDEGESNDGDGHHHRNNGGEGEGEGSNGGSEGEGEGSGGNNGGNGGRPPEPTTCTYDPNKPDTDGDNVPDDLDGCPLTPDKNLTTTIYGECVGTNADGDTYSDACDPCLVHPDPNCGMEGESESAQTDTDGDGIPDDQDGCPLDPTNTCAEQGGSEGGEQQQPASAERCDDGVDNDKDGQVDERPCEW